MSKYIGFVIYRPWNHSFMLYSSTSRDTTVKVWHVPTATEQRNLGGHSGGVTCVNTPPSEYCRKLGKHTDIHTHRNITDNFSHVHSFPWHFTHLFCPVWIFSFACASIFSSLCSYNHALWQTALSLSLSLSSICSASVWDGEVHPKWLHRLLCTNMDSEFWWVTRNVFNPIRRLIRTSVSPRTIPSMHMTVA